MSSIPTGTVTFLFTDVQGSTGLWETHYDEMNAALVLHDRILREAIEEGGGHVFKTVGDAFCAAFASAESAVGAAVDCQLGIAKASWDLPRPISVRIGVHTGKAEERNADYFGPTVNRASRLESAGHGGQILVSAVTAQLVRDRLRDDVSLISLGEHRLKDLIRAEHVHQISHPLLPQDFPPLRSLNAHPHNLPFQPTPLIGRERELEHAIEVIGREDVNLLTLTGTGGMGKTRLGLQIAAEMLEKYRHGVFFVDLARITEAELLVPSIAETLKVSESATKTLEDCLRDHLTSREMLLILDNFEQVISAAGTVAQIIAAAPDVTFLVTSREPLRLRSEHVYRVPPLSSPAASGKAKASPTALMRYDSVRLFRDCVLRVKPGFEIDEGNATAVAGICARLDGLPLAIELAAARVRIFSPEALRGRLERRLSVLTGGQRDLPDRHRTLRGAIDWSYELLSDAEKKVFAAASVFSGGFDLESAESVQSWADRDVPEILDLLVSLSDKCLFRLEEGHDGEPRFSMLESIREYAREKLGSSGQLGASLEAHARHFLSLAREAENRMRGADQVDCLRCMHAEHDNLRVALAYFEDHGEPESVLNLASSIWRFWRTIGFYSEGRRWLDGARDAGVAVDHRVRARALHAAGCLARFQGELDGSEQMLRESLALCETHPAPLVFCNACLDLGWTLHWKGDIVGAEGAFKRAKESASAIDAPREAALCDMGIGSLRRLTGDIDEALRLFQESLELFVDQGDRQNEAGALGNTGTTYHSSGDYGAARVCYLQALAIHEDFDDVTGSMIAHNNLGDIHQRLGEFTDAFGHYAKLAELAGDAGSDPLLCTASCGLAEAYLALGCYDEAEELAREAVDRAQSGGGALEIGNSHRILGECQLVLGKSGSSLEAFAESIRHLQATPALDELAKAQRGYRIALEHSEQIAATAAESGWPP